MKVEATSLPDVKLITPVVYRDTRGFFLESYQKDKLKASAGIEADFVQDNFSHSAKLVLRGLHYQLARPQGKLIMVVQGAVYDVAVDLRKSSPTFGKWVGVHLDSQTPQMLWIPPGFAHGFLTLSAQADFIYKATDFYDPSSEHCIRWDDADLGITWPISGSPLLSAKDQQGKSLHESPVFP